QPEAWVGTVQRCLEMIFQDSIHGVTRDSRPSSFFNLNELTVPLAPSCTYVSFVPDVPTRANPESCSEALILTDGRPRSVISRNNTVSGYLSPLFCVLAGYTLILARTFPW